MARVRVKWREITTYDQVLEIEDFDPDDEDQVLDAICDQGDWLEVGEVEERDVIFARELVTDG